MIRISTLLLAACSSTPAPKPEVPPASPPVDAAIAVAPPDAPAPDPELAAAPASIFRFYATGLVAAKSGHRLETWTLRALADRGVVSVERKLPGENDSWLPGTQSLYLGTATDDGKTLTLTLAAGTDKLALTCTRDKLEVATANAVRKPRAKKSKTDECGDTGVWSPAKTKSLAVLSCKDARYDAPMIFGPAPGIEYLVVNDDCKMQGGGYRQIAPDGAIAPVR
jgi:hypothetical protein